MRRPLLSLCVVASVGLLSWSAQAAPPTKQECVDAHSRGQDMRDKGKLVEAQEAFLLCAQSACPQVIQSDCAQLGNDITKLIPSVSFAARTSGGKDLPETTVSLDGAALLGRLDDGKAHEVNPGRHTVKFAYAGREVTQEVVIAQGEKARPIVAIFQDEAPAGSAPPAAPPTAPPAAPPPSAPRARPLAPLLVTGLGGVALLGGAALVLYGRSQIPSSCDLSSHECQAPPGDPAFEDARRSVSTKNVGFIVGGVGAAVTVGGLLWYLASPSESQRALAPWATPRSAGLSYGLRF